MIMGASMCRGIAASSGRVSMKDWDKGKLKKAPFGVAHRRGVD
jgi:hypothetical protein